MTAAEAINVLSQMPPDARICLHSGCEYFDIEGFELKRAYHGASPQWLYSSVEFPSDYSKTQVVKVCRKKKS
jgi:hypothetical protein